MFSSVLFICPLKLRFFGHFTETENRKSSINQNPWTGLGFMWGDPTVDGRQNRHNIYKHNRCWDLPANTSLISTHMRTMSAYPHRFPSTAWTPSWMSTETQKHPPSYITDPRIDMLAVFTEPYFCLRTPAKPYRIQTSHSYWFII